MKKVTLVLAVTIGITCLMSFTNSQYEKETNLSALNIQNQKSVKAYVQTYNGWISGFVFITDGYVTKCQFPNREKYPTPYISRKSKPFGLNPNNPLAIKYNYTHYIDIGAYGRAYFTMN
jgi:hypothetical protein